MNCPENPQKMLNHGGGWGGVEVLGVNILWTAEKIDNFFNPPFSRHDRQTVIFRNVGGLLGDH